LRRWLLGAAALLGIVILAIVSRKALAMWAQYRALRCMEAGALSDAERWLAWTVGWGSSDARHDLIAAACFRHTGRRDRWEQAMMKAAARGASPKDMGREIDLDFAQSTSFQGNPVVKLLELVDAGWTSYDVPASFVSGCLARGQYDLARDLLTAWSADQPTSVHVRYMQARFEEAMQQSDRAETLLRGIISSHPRHELARAALAALCERQKRLDLAVAVYTEWITALPRSELPRLGMARMLRESLHVDEARRVMEPVAGRPDAPPEVALEMGRIELETGDYPAACRWFERAQLRPASDTRAVTQAGIAFALAGRNGAAERLYAESTAAGNRISRSYNLEVQLLLDPSNRAVAAELRELNMPAARAGSTTEPNGVIPLGKEAEPSAGSRGERLYARHCSACHGNAGDGQGRAARHLFPRPRDLRRAPNRLVSTLNGIPTLDDLVSMLRRGMPGTSMANFQQLSADELELLAREVVRFRRQGLREQLVQAHADDGAAIDDGEISQLVDSLSAPGHVVVPPDISAGDAPSLARGQELYERLGCVTCHGADGAGTWDQTWYDERGLPVRSRDLAQEPFKGGMEPDSVYLRIVAGMPGSPHPATSGLNADQSVDLVRYCSSLRRPTATTLTNADRAAVAGSAEYLQSKNQKGR
jgi:mono/diheme cytochrome c family protein